MDDMQTDAMQGDACTAKPEGTSCTTAPAAAPQGGNCTATPAEGDKCEGGKCTAEGEKCEAKPEGAACTAAAPTE